MTTLTDKEVKKIAHLARLKIEEADIPKYTKTLSKVLNFIEQIKSVDTENLVSMSHPQDQNQRLRPDRATTTNERTSFQSIAPETEAGLYLVPKIIETCDNA